jgi:hypothetical protein
VGAGEAGKGTVFAGRIIGTKACLPFEDGRAMDEIMGEIPFRIDLF